MCPPATSPLADVGSDFSDEEIFILLGKMTSGSPLPRNVITDVNPYSYAPPNLPDGIWYLIRSEENDGTELGSWKVKGEACKLFSNSAIAGWRTTLEFFEGRVPCERKTDWVMLKYWITQKEQGEKSKAKEASSLCRVFLSGEQALDHEKQLIARPCIASETQMHPKQSITPSDHNNRSNGSSSEPKVDKDDDTGKLDATGRPDLVVENITESDYFSRGDYLELLDLDNPASSSSSSDNSSRISMSSDEYFDSWALLRDLESESNQRLTQKDENCKFSVTAPHKPHEVVVLPASKGSSIGIGGDNLHAEGTDSSSDGNSRKDLIIHKVVGNEKTKNKDGGPSTNSHAGGTSSDCRIASPDEEEKAARPRGKRLKKKYLCFMPFYFLL